MAPRKILMLHGYAQSATILQKRMGAVRKACKGVELVFVDAPHILSPADIAESFNTAEELGASEASDADPALAPRAWWRTDAQRTKTIGVEASFEMMRDILSKDHYDGVFGFSQGACFAAWLAALSYLELIRSPRPKLERPETFPSFLIDGKSPHPPFAFCVAVAGFKPSSPLSNSIFLDGYSTPTLHVIGRNDVIVVEERAKTLLAVSINMRVEYHDGGAATFEMCPGMIVSALMQLLGHFVPSKANWRAFFRDYLLKAPAEDVPSPSLSTGSQPASGTSTPVTVNT
ncbi:serine hydrolase-domain-containing protein [Cytidiella melzeri]|nr:serine hydrolase-domain-containing protein [Cytidiella melzeri]